MTYITIKQVNEASITYCEHYIPHIHQSDILHLESTYVIPILRPCSGCNLHVPYYYRDLRCIIMSSTNQLVKFFIHSRKYKPTVSTLSLPKNSIFPISSLSTLRTLAFNVYKLATTAQYPYDNQNFTSQTIFNN